MRIFHLDYFVMQTTRKSMLDYLLSKGHFQSTDFESRTNTHSENKQDAKTLTFASMWLSSFLASRTFSERGTPEAAGSGCCTMATSEISGGWVVTTRCEPGGLLNLLHSNGLQKFCPGQTLVMGIFLRQEEEAEGQRK